MTRTPGGLCKSTTHSTPARVRVQYFSFAEFQQYQDATVEDDDDEDDAAATTPARPHPTPAQIGIITFTWNLYTIGALALSIVLLVLFLLVYGGTLGLTMSGSSADGTIGNTSFI